MPLQHSPPFTVSTGRLKSLGQSVVLAGASESPKIATGMAEHPLLPEIVETLDVRVAPRFPRRDEEEMDAQEQMQAHDQREGYRGIGLRRSRPSR
jgi:hypothetical protein